MVGVEVSIVLGVEVVIAVVDTIGGVKNSMFSSVLDGNWDAGVSSMMVMSGVGCCGSGVSSMMVGDLSVLCFVIFSVSDG